MTKHLRFSLLMLLMAVFNVSVWGQVFEKVTSADDLSDGDVVIIVNETNKKALGTTQNSNNRAATDVTISNSSITPDNNVQQITLVASDQNWMLKVGDDQYLYAASNSSNHLKTNTAKTVGNNGVASIEITNGDATIKFIGNNARNLLRYNSSNSLFSCYASGQATVQLYKKATAEDTREDGTIAFYQNSQVVESINFDGVNKLLIVTYECNAGKDKVSFSSSNTAVATASRVGEDLYISTIGEGTTTITANFPGNDNYKSATATLLLTVTDNRENVVLSFGNVPETIKIGEQGVAYQVTADVDLTQDDPIFITYESSAPSVLAVEPGDGTLVPYAEGTATITAKFEGSEHFKPATASYTIKVVDPNVTEKTATLTNENITAATRGTSYANVTITDDNGNTWTAYAIKNYHSNATNEHHFLQIKKNDSSGPYYIKVPQFGTKIAKIEMTVSGTGQAMTGGSGSATLFFSNTNQTKEAGKGVASSTVNDEKTKAIIDCSELELNEGYITAGGAIRIWDITVTYKTANATEITFDDAAHEGTYPTNADIVSAHDGETVDVTVSRAFQANKWNTVYLPFALTAEQVAGIFGEGTKVAGYKSYDEEGHDFMFQSVNAMEANVPYLLNPTNNLADGFTAEGVTIVKGQADPTADIIIATGPAFVGLMDNHTFTGTLNVYYLSTSGKIRRLADGGSLKAMRAFFTTQPDEENGGDAAAKTFSIDGEVTGIIAVENSVQTIEDGQFYNIAGQRVGSAYKGIVIVGGKKVVKK